MKRLTHSYIRTYRKRSGLTQRDLGLLVGFVDGAEVGRYERSLRLPNTQSLLACQVVFDVEPRVLFPDMHERVEQLVVKRALELRDELPRDQWFDRKCAVLNAIAERSRQRANLL